MDTQSKRNGIFRARLVACGYSQVPGIDFNESFAPFLNDVSFRIMLIANLVWDMTRTVVDKMKFDLFDSNFRRIKISEMKFNLLDSKIRRWNLICLIQKFGDEIWLVWFKISEKFLNPGTPRKIQKSIINIGVILKHCKIKHC
jgi:hypothetical protein